MRIAVCDDVKLDVKRMCDMLGSKHLVSCYYAAEPLLVDTEELGKRFDLYLLDIFLKDMNGVELAARLRALDQRALLCFISSSGDFYREAYDLYVFQYLIKPVKQMDMDELLERAGELIQSRLEQSVMIENRADALAIPYSQLMFISSRGHYLCYQCKNGDLFEGRGKLDELSRKLDPAVFCRCHQSYIVNLGNITKLLGNEFICGNYRIPISRRYKNAKGFYRLSLEEGTN